MHFPSASSAVQFLCVRRARARLPGGAAAGSVRVTRMREFLFDVAWWLPVVVAIGGVGLLISGNNRQRAGLRNAGAAVVLLAVAWLVLSFVIDTPRKTCQRLARQAVQSVADGDWQALSDLLAPDADARYVDRPWRVDGRQGVLDAARMVARNAGLHSAGVGHVRASAAPDEAITVAFTAFTDTDLTPGHPIDSDWEFDFRPQPPTGRWQIHEIRVLRVDQTQPEGIRESLNKR